MTVKLERLHLMTLVASAFYLTTSWYFVIPFVSLFSLALLFRQLLGNYLYWTIVVALQGFTLVRLGLDENTYAFLLFYLSSIAFVATLSPDPEEVFARNSRLLIGFIFLFATFWKLVGSGFLSGDFFGYYLLHDRLLAPVALLLTDLSQSDILANRAALEGVWDGSLTLRTSPQVQRLAFSLTWLSLIIEAVIAVAFLAPFQLAKRMRDPLLVVFLFTSYLIVPVPSVGMSLACLSYAQTEHTWFQRCYLIAFLVMPLTALRYYTVLS